MCNRACIDFGTRLLHARDVQGRDVLEVGAADHNGTLRGHVAALGPTRYVGVDIEAGPGVDTLCSVEDLVERFGPDRFDVVLTTEMLEHVRDWRRAVVNLKGVLKPGGVLLITTRSAGFGYHGAPHDYWRYSSEDMRAIFADMDDVVVEGDPLQPGVFVFARKRATAPSVDLSTFTLHSIVTGRRMLDIDDRTLRSFLLRYRARALLSRLVPEPLKARVRERFRPHYWPKP